MVTSVLPKRDSLRLDSLLDHYDVEFFEMDPDGIPIFLGTTHHSRCRFCNLTEPQTTFNNIAHAIPRLVGNNTLFSLYECDSCNRWLGKTYENHFGTYTHPIRTIGQTQGRHGVPSLNLGKSKITCKKDSGPEIFVYPDGKYITFEDDNNRIVFSKTREPYIPRSVFKSLVKMALSLMPESVIKNFQQTIEWIMTEPYQDPVISNMFRCHTWFKPGPKPIRVPTAAVSVRKPVFNESEYPHVIFFIAFDNMAFQIMIPFSDLDKHLTNKKASLITFPAPFAENDPYGPVERECIDFSSNEQRTDHLWSHALNYSQKLLR